MEGAVPQGAAPFPFGTAWHPAGWGGYPPITGEYAMGRNVTLGIGTLIIILIIVARVF